MEFITIITFDNSVEAHIMKSKLKSENIKSYLFDEHIVSINPLYNITVGGIKLKVDERDENNAFKLVEEYYNSRLLDDQGGIIQCSNCQSKDFYKGYKSMKGIKGILSGIFSLLFIVYPIFYKTVIKCKSCGHEF